MVLMIPKKNGAAPADKPKSSLGSLGKKPAEAEAAKSSFKDKAKTTSTVNFVKKGSAAREALDTEEARAEAAKLEASKMRRFMMKPSDDRDYEEYDLTFLNGEIGEDGMLDLEYVDEHTVELNGKWRNFLCTAEKEMCPICEEGKKAALVGVLTVINHNPYKVQNGPNKGKVLKNVRQLYMAKRGTLKMLLAKAKKHDGLAGCRFTVGRTDGNAPNVGNQFEFNKKYGSYDEIAEDCNLTIDDVQPAEALEELTYYNAEALREMGVGRKVKGPGYGKFGSGGGKGGKTAKDLADAV